MVVKKNRKRGKGTSVDFGGVESGGMAVPDGNYLAYPESVELTEAESSGNEMFKFKWKITGPKCKGAVVWDNAVLVPQSLWRLKTILELMGLDVPDGEMEIDPADLEGEDHTLMLEITNEKYKGKDQPRITSFGDPSALQEDDDDDDDNDDDDKDEKSSKKPGKKPSKKDEDDDDSTDDDSDTDDPPKKPDKKIGKTPKIKEGSKVTFQDEKGKTHRATVTEVDGDEAKVEEKDGTEWEISVEDLELV